MTTPQMLEMLTALTGERDDKVLLIFLDLAAEKILAKCYPFRSDIREVPAKYHNTQVEIAAYMLNKRGAEGETSHNENGVSRSYESAGVPDSMLRCIVPFAEVVS